MDFGERLRAAMLAKGLRAPEDLARIAGISVPMARRWLRMRAASMSAVKLAPTAESLGVRMLWLASGRGVVQATPTTADEELAALAVAAALHDCGKLERWLDCGRKLVLGR